MIASPYRLIEVMTLLKLISSTIRYTSANSSGAPHIKPSHRSTVMVRPGRHPTARRARPIELGEDRARSERGSSEIDRLIGAKEAVIGSQSGDRRWCAFGTGEQGGVPFTDLTCVTKHRVGKVEREGVRVGA